MEKRWNILPCDTEQAARLQESLNIAPILCRLLVQRGILTFDAARDFFRPSLENLHSPWLMKDMQAAVKRIGKAIEQGEKILVFGDYDVDGTTAVASLYSFLKKQAAPGTLDFYIPNRYREGYGVSKTGIDYANDNGYTLIISLDCGIKSIDLIAYARTLQIDFIVCDHHLPDNVLPDAVAILNPKQADCPYPYKELCGCGVGFKLMMALAEAWDLPDESYLEYIDLCAVAIAADIVDMTGENRILAYHGLQKINNNPSVGIAAIIQQAGIKSSLNITNVVFMIAPRVNAAGRMDDARKAVQLFIEPDATAAATLAAELNINNTERKEADSSITAEALEMIAQDDSFKNRKSSVVYAEHWHKGVVGIVASRLIEHHYRPTVVLTRNGDMVTGSARSVSGFNLYEAIHACREHLIAYGGHFAAAGLSLKPEKIELFSATFDRVVSETIEPHLLTPEITIDAPIALPDVTMKMYNILQQMEPFGPGNMRPVFVATRVCSTQATILKEKHLRLNIAAGTGQITAIGFNMHQHYPVVQPGNYFDMVFPIDVNEWNGKQSLQLRLLDIRKSTD